MLTVLRCGQLFTGHGAGPLAATSVVVEDGRIREVGVIDDPPGASTIDLSPYFVMPGFVDAHTHLSVRPGLGDQLGQLRQPAGRQALRVPDNLRQDLDAG